MKRNTSSWTLKNFYFLLFFEGVMILLSSTGCSKELPVSGAGFNTGTYYPPTLTPNRAPAAFAGSDFTGTLYSSTLKLRGNAYDQDMGDRLSTTWTQIAGAPVSIVSPQSVITAVNNLVVGEYLFELLVRDSHGATDRDTIAIKVNSIEPISSPVNFFNLGWSCPMGCTIPIYYVYPHIPPNAPCRIYIKYVNSPDWHEAVPISQYASTNSIYFYEIEGGENIILYTDDGPNIMLDVKIVF